MMSAVTASAILNAAAATHPADFDIMTRRALRRHADTPVRISRCKSIRA